MSDSWNFICDVAKRERPGISKLTLLKWKQRGVPHWLRAKALEAAQSEGLLLTSDDFGPQREGAAA